MSLIKKIKQFINGSWQEFNIHSDSLNNVVDLSSDQDIYGIKYFLGGTDESIFSGPKKGTSITGSAIYLSGVDHTKNESGPYAALGPGSLTLNDEYGRPVTYDRVGITNVNDTYAFPTAAGTLLTDGSLNLEGGEANGSVAQVLYEEGQRKGSNAYGKYSIALNQNNNAYQRNSFAIGGATQAGLTEEEFMAKYPEGVDKYGYNYAKANSYAFSSGQETKSLGRGTFVAGGYKNTIIGDYSGSLGGGSNNIDGEYCATVAGYQNTLTETASKSSVLDGYNNTVSGENSGVGGANNNVAADASHAFGLGLEIDASYGHNKTVVGKYNNKESFSIFQVGAGSSNEVRKNAFEVFENGVAQTSNGVLATREWVTNVDKTILGDTTLYGDIILAGGEIRLTDEVILSGSEIYYDGQYVGDFHPNAPRSYANKRWVESLVTNQVQYLGIVNSVGDITNAFYSSDSALGKAGDFVRAGSSFTIETETVHPGDIIIANNVSFDISLANYDIIHTEDPGNYGSLEGHNVFNGYNTFNGGVEINCDYSYNDINKRNGFSVNIDYSGETMGLQLNPGGLAIGDYDVYAGTININPRSVTDHITYYPVNAPGTYMYTLPTKTGTFALLSDIPTNYVTTDTDQTISGGKTFYIHTHMDSTDRTRFEVYHTAEIGMGLFDYTFACGAYWPSIEGNGKSMYISSTGFQRGDDAGSSTWFTLPTESLDPATHDLTLATRGWVKANTICSSTIDQEFFNSLY